MRKWITTTVRTNQEANAMVEKYLELKPKYGAFDTETNGLHIVQCTPFLFQWGFLHPTEHVGYSYVVDLEQQPELARQTITVWNELAKSLELYAGHNVKFDLHMLLNINLPYGGTNLTDTQFFIRYGHDNRRESEGGPPLGLKKYAQQYIDSKAKTHEKLLSTERTKIAADLNQKLIIRLRATEDQAVRKSQYTKKAVDDLLKDCVADASVLPTAEAQQAYTDWLRFDVPKEIRYKVISLVTSDMIPYSWLNRENVIHYAHYDIVYTLEVLEKLKPIVEYRENTRGIEIEQQLIYPLVEMERVGFKVDVAYLTRARDTLKAYIIQRRTRLWEIAGRRVKVSQSAVIKEILQRSVPEITSTDKEELSHVAYVLQQEHRCPEAVELINILQELRRLEKWYSTYIIRYLMNLHDTDTIYTQINQVGTISGRVSSDFQQFPRGGIKTVDGVEIFQPRKMFATPDGYEATVYLDYSQIELRFQAFYTILVGHPDLNLCRAYMPYKCVSPVHGTFDWTNPEHITHWQDPWYLEEEPTKQWEPVDVHGATTTAATGLKAGDEGFDKARSEIGKRTNFAKNYGAQYGRIAAMFPTKSPEEVQRINDAYYIAFPGVKTYHDYCYGRTVESSTQNLFGIRYYNVSGHNLINLLIQGSAAYFLKLKIIEVTNYLKSKNIKTKWQMQIHDELSFIKHRDDDAQLFFDIKHIMEEWPEAYVPIVADMEATKTLWANKQKGIEDTDALRSYLSS